MLITNLKLEAEDRAITAKELREFVQAMMKSEVPDDATFEVQTYRMSRRVSSMEVRPKLEEKKRS